MAEINIASVLTGKLRKEGYILREECPEST
jgi:hypothetical protein